MSGAIYFKHKGEFSRTLKFLNCILDRDYLNVLDKYGRQGVSALAAATPKDTGKTAESWDYTIEQTKTGAKITFTNSNIQNGAPIAILLQYGHATRTGGWVEGRDYINPVVQPLFDRMAEEAWKEVTRL